MSTMPSVSLLDLTRSELAEQVAAWGFKPVHAASVWRALYGENAADFAALDDLPSRLRDRLQESAPIVRLPITRETHSCDGFTRKYLLALADGRQIETVLMRYTGRVTACISSQVGCAMGCVFCATGQMGFDRHLTTGEIVAQARPCRPGAA
jgi:23S rRNA (adenine2503-C2)-methyltransferase